MITILFGAPGTGKTSLLTHFLKDAYIAHGRALLSYTKARISALNETRTDPLAAPESPPIFANYRTSFKVGYEKTFEPYFVNPYYMGLPNDRMPVQHLPPGAKVFITEAQRYYNSRKSSTLPDHVSRLFEMHRHYGLDFYLDTQRANLIDLNIKEICKRFLEVRAMQHEQDETGRILRSVFCCFEFDCWRAVEQYMETGAETYKKVRIMNEGNIFRSFDSYSCADEFLPREGQAFDCLTFPARGSAPEPGRAMFYKTEEPAEFRAQGRKSAGKEGKQSA